MHKLFLIFSLKKLNVRNFCSKDYHDIYVLKLLPLSRFVFIFSFNFSLNVFCNNTFPLFFKLFYSIWKCFLTCYWSQKKVFCVIPYALSCNIKKVFCFKLFKWKLFMQNILLDVTFLWSVCLSLGLFIYYILNRKNFKL